MKAGFFAFLKKLKVLGQIYLWDDLGVLLHQEPTLKHDKDIDNYNQHGDDQRSTSKHDDQLYGDNDLGPSPEGLWHAALCRETAENESNSQSRHQDRDYGDNYNMKLGKFMEFKVEKEIENIKHKVTKDGKTQIITSCIKLQQLNQGNLLNLLQFLEQEKKVSHLNPQGNFVNHLNDLNQRKAFFHLINVVAGNQ